MLDKLTVKMNISTDTSLLNDMAFVVTDPYVIEDPFELLLVLESVEMEVFTEVAILKNKLQELTRYELIMPNCLAKTIYAINNSQDAFHVCKVDVDVNHLQEISGQGLRKSTASLSKAIEGLIDFSKDTVDTIFCGHVAEDVSSLMTNAFTMGLLPTLNLELDVLLRTRASGVCKPSGDS